MSMTCGETGIGPYKTLVAENIIMGIELNFVQVTGSSVFAAGR